MLGLKLWSALNGLKTRGGKRDCPALHYWESCTRQTASQTLRCQRLQENQGPLLT